MGDGLAPLANAPNAVPTFIDKYTTSGLFVSSIPMPTTLTGSNHPLTEAANSTSVGHLARSVDGRYLTLGGYDADAGATNIRQTTAGRVIGRVTLSSGAVDTTTDLMDAYPGSAGNNNDMRSAVSTDGTKFWTSGTSFPSTTANGNSGIHYATLGSTTSFRLSPVGTGLLNNTRVANIYNGQLYTSSASGSFVGISKVGTGIPEPTANDQSAITLYVGTSVSGSGTASPYDFWFKDDNTVYVADDRTTATGGGIQKWITTDSGASWNLDYVLNTNLGTGGVRGLDGAIVNGNAVLYASTAPSVTDGTINNSIVTVTDTGAASAFSTVFTAPTNTMVRGVVFVPGPAGIAGDYNNDGKVDAADYVTWRTNPGANGGDPAGYNTWRANFGTGGPGAGLGAGAVPEPTSVALFVLGLIALGCRQRRS